jgi:hypothetical protein
MRPQTLTSPSSGSAAVPLQVSTRGVVCIRRHRSLYGRSRDEDILTHPATASLLSPPPRAGAWLATGERLAPCHTAHRPHAGPSLGTLPGYDGFMLGQAGHGHLRSSTARIASLYTPSSPSCATPLTCIARTPKESRFRTLIIEGVRKMQICEALDRSCRPFSAHTHFRPRSADRPLQELPLETHPRQIRPPSRRRVDSSQIISGLDTCFMRASINLVFFASFPLSRTAEVS